MKKVSVSACIILVILALSAACSRDSSISPPPGTTRNVYRWLDDIFYVQQNEYREFAFNSVINDTVYGEVVLLNGEEISMCAIMDEENFIKWENDQTCQFIQYFSGQQYYEFYFCMPVSGSCYLVVLNAWPNSIEVRAAIYVARWEQ